MAAGAGRLEGKVAFITGVARGQGRAHAVRMAAEGADIIGVDICAPIDSVPYELATPEDLAETERLVKAEGRQITARVADVRERSELRAALDGVERIDVVVANAGILPMAMHDPHAEDFVDATDVDLIGAMNAVAVALPHLPDGASIIVTGSTAGMIPGTAETPVMGPGGDGYAWSKRVLMEYVEHLARWLAPRLIRVNAVHPTNVDTPLIHNDGLYEIFRPDIVRRGEKPTREEVEPAFVGFQAMPIPYVLPEDVAALAVFLASDESRYITGQQIRIDAGSLLQFPGLTGR